VGKSGLRVLPRDPLPLRAPAPQPLPLTVAPRTMRAGQSPSLGIQPSPRPSSLYKNTPARVLPELTARARLQVPLDCCEKVPRRHWLANLGVTAGPPFRGLVVFRGGGGYGDGRNGPELVTAPEPSRQC